MKKNCEWKYDDEAWNTGCKTYFIFNEEGPAENGFEFCPFCGGHIVIANETDS